MPFQFCDSHITGFYRDGYTVFRGILPPSLIADLRRESDKARELARQKRGPQAQRAQPIGAYGLETKPFRDYAELPDLADAINRLFGPGYSHFNLDSMGILIEPRDWPCCTAWHRDITENTPGVDAEDFRVVNSDPRFFAQVNCALYADAATWYVPGSNNRPDTQAERAAATRVPDVEGKSNEEREALCVEYCRGMPGGVCLALEPGDYAIYAPNGWHLGNYAPYRRRATLHDGAWTPRRREWYARWTERGAANARSRKAEPAPVG